MHENASIARFRRKTLANSFDATPLRFVAEAWLTKSPSAMRGEHEGITGGEQAARSSIHMPAPASWIRSAPFTFTLELRTTVSDLESFGDS